MKIQAVQCCMGDARQESESFARIDSNFRMRMAQVDSNKSPVISSGTFFVIIIILTKRNW